MSRPFGLYVHVPFCRRRCDFCSFYLEIYREQAATGFLSALLTEIQICAKQDQTGGRPLQSIYFGGGTPTVLGAHRLLEVLDGIRMHFPLAGGCEVTIEAHPATVSKEVLCRLAEGGVTRLSFGAESMEDDELVRIGRSGLTSETVAAVLDARAAGFSDINLDLMYGLPGQSVESWRHTLDRCLELSPTHLSCYALTVEEGTQLARAIELRRSQAPDETLQVMMDESAQEVLGSAGYERYEISNYARPGYACRHNLVYWTHGEYLGIGPSAQSFVEGIRFGNVANLTAYEAALAEKRLPQVDRVALTKEEQLRDAVIFGLRLTRGIETQHLYEHGMNYGHSATIAELQRQQLITADAARARLTSKGRLYADRVAEQLY